MILHLFSFLNAFAEGSDSLHPGFSVDGTVVVLTHKRPWKRSFIKIPSAVVRSDHFKARSDFVYLAIGEKTAYRYNNASGGHLCLDSLLLMQISKWLQKPTNSLTIKTVKIMQKIQIVAPWEKVKEFLPENQVDLLPENHTEEDLIINSAGEVLTMQEVCDKLSSIEDAETVHQYRESYPGIMDRVLGATLAATVKPLFPEITLDKALAALPQMAEVAELIEANAGKNPLQDEQALTDFTRLEGILGTPVNLDGFPLTDNEDNSAPAIEVDEINEEKTEQEAIPTETEVPSESAITMTTSNNAVAVSNNAAAVKLAKSMSVVLQNVAEMASALAELLENANQPVEQQ